MCEDYVYLKRNRNLDTLVSTSEKTTSRHDETKHILLLWHPRNEPIKGSNTLSGHQMQLSGAEEIKGGRAAESSSLFVIHASGSPPRR